MKQSSFVTPLESYRRVAEIQRLKAVIAEAVAKKWHAETRFFNSALKDEE